MRIPRQFRILALIAAVVGSGAGRVQAQASPQPLTEEKIARLVALRVKGEAIASMVQAQGLAFKPDPATIARLEAAGTPAVAIDAINKAGAAGGPPPEGAVTYADLTELLGLGVPEAEILDRLKQSPTTFTLGQDQVAELTRLGASPKLLAAVGAVRASFQPSAEMNNLVLVLDCSGSMSERTAEGSTKMEAAKQAALGLVREVPDGVRLAFLIYGHDRAQECNAVQVARPLAALDQRGRDDLVRLIGGLQPVGSTPIALALRTAGAELAKAQAPSGLVLISDGKEMCGGDPATEAAALLRSSKMASGVQVVGFGVKPDERLALEQIALSGKGRYYDAPTPGALRDVVGVLAREIREEAKPAPEASRLTVARRGQARFVTIAQPTIQFPPTQMVYLTIPDSNQYHDPIGKPVELGQQIRIPPVEKGDTFDLWWVPKDEPSRQMKMVANLKVTADQSEVVVHPEEHLGMVRLLGKDLPAADQVFVGPANLFQDFARFMAFNTGGKIQAAAGFGQDIVVPPGTYNLWFHAKGEEYPEMLAEKIEVVAGKVTVVE